MRVKLYARAEVVRRLRVDAGLLRELVRERIVIEQKKGRYAEGDLDRIRVAAELRKLGVNNEGIEVALRMREGWLAERADLLHLIDRLVGRARRHS
jgi:DNA-binding transcriptional MerR regulator